jgi:hypothetical protein
MQGWYTFADSALSTNISDTYLCNTARPASPTAVLDR